MPAVDALLAFFGVAVLLALSPGPDNLFVLVQSVQRGWRVGMCVVLGLCLGIVVHTTAVALGLAAVFAASSAAFTVLKWCGAAYLAWLAWGALRAPASTSAAPQVAGQLPPLPWREALRMVGRGVVMNLTNPKVLIFFLAFLPQFADPARGQCGAANHLLWLGVCAGNLLGVWRDCLFFRGFWRLAAALCTRAVVAEPAGGAGVSGAGRAAGYGAEVMTL